MIKHIVAFTAKNPDDAGTIKQELEKMATIPSVGRLEVSYNAKRDKLSKEVDIVLYSEFDSWSDLDAYQAHPLHLATTAVVRPLRDQRIVVDYET